MVDPPIDPLSNEAEITDPNISSRDFEMRGDPPPYSENNKNILSTIDPNQFINLDLPENQNVEANSILTVLMNYSELINYEESPQVVCIALLII